MRLPYRTSDEKITSVPRSDSAVLFSGGWDCLYCLIKAQAAGDYPDLLFFDYGQPYLEQELKAVMAMKESGLKNLFICDYQTLTAQKIKNSSGIFDNRNGRFLLQVSKFDYRRVYFGSRNLIPLFDKYGDSNFIWAKRQGRELGIEVMTPATAMPKSWIIWTCRRQMPDFAQHVFSTEGLS